MKKFRWQAHKPLLAAALAVAGVFNMVSVVVAEGVAAGTDITNTATATYNDGVPDPNTGLPNEYEATSNTVVIKVAEIAGLTAVARPILDADGGAIEDGDDLTFIFDVTNVGNAPTDVFVPVPTTENVDLTGDVEVFANDGTTLIGTLSAAGLVVDPLSGSPVQLAPDDFFVVQVTGTPSAGTVAGDTVGVTLGDTTDNADEGPDPTQNQADDSDPGVLTTDLRTVDPTDTDPTDDPENGEREAEATADAIFASSVRPLALATVLKTAATINVGDPSVATDDLITYDLGLRVEDSEPTNLFQPSALEGTDITLGATAATAVTEKRILVSDSIPVGTVLESVSTSLPAGWTAVYTEDASDDALSLTWVTTPPTDLSTVERIGFVFDGTIPNNGIATTGLMFTVETSGTTPPVDGTVENIAQVFGQTVGDPDPNPQVIYDESGDQNPNNYDPVLAEYPDPDGSDYDPTVDTGIVPESDGDGDGQPDTPGDVDNGNDNTGAGPDGEPNVVLLNPTTDDILNGTQDTPNAVGPVGDNDDFTNQSTPTPAAGTDPTAPFDPDPVVFNNSLANPATTGNIANVTIEPLSPSQSEAASEDPNNPGDTDGFFGSDSDIPAGTLVTITAPGVPPAVYVYVEDGDPSTDDGNFDLQSGNPVNVGAVVASEEVDYTVTVDLPDGTAQLAEIPIPIIAFPDNQDVVTEPDIGYSGEVTNNITIDRVYTGFMELVKEARILDENGVERAAFAEVLIENAAPGEFIEYRISYRNISQAATGFGSVTLTANDFVLLEDGNDAVVGNDWATTTTHQQNTAASAGDVNYFTNSADAAAAATADPADGTTIEKYTNVVPTVAPEVDGTFEFRRVVD